jgi:hypothetical protein
MMIDTDLFSFQDREEYMQRLQVLFAYLFYRCSHFSEGMLQIVLSVVRPPILRASAAELKEVQELLLALTSTIIRGHMRLTTHFIKNTDYGREYYETAEKRRRSKLRLPDLNVDQIISTLDLPVPVVRVLWYPLAAVVPAHLWSAIPRADGEEWKIQSEADTPVLAGFRLVSAEIVARTARVWTASQDELSSHAQVAVLKDISPMLFVTPWPQLSVTTKFIRFFRKGVFAPDNTNAFLDQAFRPPAAPRVSAEPELPSQDHAKEDLPSQDLSSQDLPSQLDSSQITPEPESTKTEPADTKAKQADTESEDDIDGVIQSQINAALQAVEVVGRPVIFGSEFPETGGYGLGRTTMTEIMDLNDDTRAGIVDMLEETGDSVLQNPFSSEEANAIASMGGRAIARYAIRRLEKDNEAIMEAIWRMQQIVDQNQSELAEIRSHIAQEMEKRRFFDSVSAQMSSTYTSIEQEGQMLADMTGAQDRDEANDGDQASHKPSWKDRAREAQQGKLGMKWKYNPKQATGQEAQGKSRLHASTPGPSALGSGIARPSASQPLTTESERPEDQAEQKGDSSVTGDGMAV